MAHTKWGRRLAAMLCLGILLGSLATPAAAMAGPASYSLTYDRNGGTLPDDFPMQEEHPAHEVFVPGQPPVYWPATWNEERIVFVGWTENQESAPAPFDRENPYSILTLQLEMPDSPKTLYAVWAYDRNGDALPDYVDFDEWHQMRFSLNGGTGDAPEPAAHWFLSGTATALPMPPADPWTLSLDDRLGVFAGWSLQATEVIFDQNGRGYDALNGDMDLTQEGFLLEPPYTVPTDTSGDLYVFAVYAEDRNINGVPDYTEPAAPVRYYANGGTAIPGSGVTVADDGRFYACSHHHVAGERDVLLMGLAEVLAMIRKDGAVFSGWSTRANVDLLRTREDEKNAALINTVDIPDGPDAHADVYAVWAADQNGDRTPDYNEDTPAPEPPAPAEPDTAPPAVTGGEGGEGPAPSPTPAPSPAPAAITSIPPTADRAALPLWLALAGGALLSLAAALTVYRRGGAGR